MHKINFYTLGGFLVLIPLLFIPSASVAFLYGKVGLLTLAAIVPMIILLVSTIYKGELLLSSPFILAAWLVVPLSVTIAALVSANRIGSLIGRGLEYSTAYFTLLCFLIIGLYAVYFQKKQKVFFLYIGFLAAFALIALFSFLRFIFGAHFLSLGLFTSVVSNTIGSWSDFGIYAGIAVILAFVTLEFLDLERVPKIILYVILAAGLVLTSFANFYVIFDLFGVSISLNEIIGFFALLTFLYAASLNYQIKSAPPEIMEGEHTIYMKRGSGKAKMPFASLVVLIVIVLASMWDSSISSAFNSYTNVSAADVTDIRPTMSSTFSVAENVIKSGIRPAITGVGPERFFAAWSDFKPAGVNETDLWNTDFEYGISYILTSLTTTGILGFLCWLFFLGAFLWINLRAIFSGVKDKFSLYLIVSSFTVAAYLWFMAFFSDTGATILILAAVFTGLSIASLFREEVLSTVKISWSASHRKGFISLFVIVLVIISLVVAASIWIDRCIASVEATHAVAAVNAGNAVQGENLLLSAISKDGSDTYLNLYAQAKLYDLQQTLTKEATSTLDATNSAIYSDALTAALQAARVANPYSYQNWIFLGNVYQIGAQLGVDQSAQYARDAYAVAEQLAPQSPLPFFLTGQLYALAHQYDLARASLNQALALKSNYTDAQTLLGELPASTGSPASATTLQTSTGSTAATSTLVATSTKKTVK